MEVILPTKHQISMTSSSDNNLCSILCTNEKAFSWVMDHYTFMWMRQSILQPKVRCISNMPIMSSMDMQRDCEYIEQKQFLYADVLDMAVSFIEFVINSIDEGWYIIAYLNHDYMPQSAINSFHKSMIVGYNLEDKCLYVEDCFDNGKYVCMPISFDDVEASFKSLGNEEKYLRNACREMDQPVVTRARLVNTKEIDAIYIKKGTHTTAYKKELIYTLSDMYYGQPMHVGQRSYGHQLPVSENSFYGVEIYNGLKEYIDEIVKDKALNFDYRLFTTIRDYNLLMSRRIEYLAKNKLIDISNSELVAISDSVCKNSVICLNQAIKYDMLGKDDLISDMKKTLDENYHLSREMIYNLLELLLRNVDHTTYPYISI